MGDLEYRLAWEQVILPVAEEFNPELVLISAGFDACEGDTVGMYSVSPECFGAMVSGLQNVARGRQLLLLEGGYNVDQTALAFASCAEALLGKKISWPEFTKWDAVKPEAVEAVEKTRQAHRQYWRCFQ